MTALCVSTEVNAVVSGAHASPRSGIHILLILKDIHDAFVNRSVNDMREVYRFPPIILGIVVHRRPFLKGLIRRRRCYLLHRLWMMDVSGMTVPCGASGAVVRVLRIILDYGDD